MSGVLAFVVFGRVIWVAWLLLVSGLMTAAGAESAPPSLGAGGGAAGVGNGPPVGAPKRGKARSGRVSVIPSPPSYAHWIVRRQLAEDYAKSKEVKENKALQGPIIPLQVEFLKTPVTGKVVVTWEPGVDMVSWYYKSFDLRKFASGREIFVHEIGGRGSESGPSESGSSGGAGDWSVVRYPGFDWVREEMLVGQVTAHGKECLYYRHERPAQSMRFKKRRLMGDGNGAEPVEQKGGRQHVVNQELDDARTVAIPALMHEAWVTVEGKWPVAERVGPFLDVFQHLQAPRQGSEPQLPAEFASALKSYCADWGYDVPKL